MLSKCSLGEVRKQGSGLGSAEVEEDVREVQLCQPWWPGGLGWLQAGADLGTARTRRPCPLQSDPNTRWIQSYSPCWNRGVVRGIWGKGHL